MIKQCIVCFLYGFIAVLMTANRVLAEETADTSLSGGDGNARLEYAGDRTRLGLGINNDGDLSGEVLQVFNETDTSAFIGEAWFGNIGGGLKLNYHWLVGDEKQPHFVSKLFAGVDQNADSDRKVSVGAGFENEHFFGGAYVSKGISNARELSPSTSTQTETFTGMDSVGSWQQDQTTTIIIRRFAKPYDYGVGLRAGKYMEQGLWRLRVGADYEWGDYNAEQYTYSAGVEKFFSGTPYGVALNIQLSERSGDFDPDNSDTSAMLVWRYTFGENYRPESSGKNYRPESSVENYRPDVETQEAQLEVSEPASEASISTEYKIIKHEVDVKADAFFDLNSSNLREEFLGDLEKLAKMLSEKRILGKISLVGQSCDLGPEKYNQVLSERRAAAVKTKLVEYGIPAEQIITEGRGESNPRYPNDSEENRSKNRRVDIHFLLLEENRVEIPAKAPSEPIEMVTEEISTKAPSESIEMVTEEVVQPPIWHKRALVNPIQHKRRVDVYHYETTETTTETDDKVYLNRFPVAEDDTVSVNCGGGANLFDVLANDRDDDGNPLTIVSVTQPANGTVENFGDLISFTPAPGFTGETEFTYTVSDGQDGIVTATAVSGQNGQTTATVRVTVISNPLTLADDSASTNTGQAVNIDVLANDSTPNGGALSLTTLGSPSNGSVEIRDGQVVYTSDAGFSGNDSFSYTATDAVGEVAIATVTVTVLLPPPPNKPPVANDDSLVTGYAAEYSVNVLMNDSDPDGDSLTITGLSNLPPEKIGTYTFNGPNIIFRPGSGWNRGLVTVTYTITDGRGGSDSAVLSILDP
ncbi:MAG: tandem-95 repeat protein [Proteobacteria bacterium]|nr:tandem-95 repeat protein [Pseudomonadota bacterium]MBU1717082.1 tandem-95 repeat protein [Pseudomonadota bacterium]